MRHGWAGLASPENWKSAHRTRALLEFRWDFFPLRISTVVSPPYFSHIWFFPPSRQRRRRAYVSKHCVSGDAEHDYAFLSVFSLRRGYECCTHSLPCRKPSNGTWSIELYACWFHRIVNIVWMQRSHAAAEGFSEIQFIRFIEMNARARLGVFERCSVFSRVCCLVASEDVHHRSSSVRAQNHLLILCTTEISLFEFDARIVTIIIIFHFSPSRLHRPSHVRACESFGFNLHRLSMLLNTNIFWALRIQRGYHFLWHSTWKC